MWVVVAISARSLAHLQLFLLRPHQHLVVPEGEELLFHYFERLGHGNFDDGVGGVCAERSEIVRIFNEGRARAKRIEWVSLVVDAAIMSVAISRTSSRECSSSKRLARFARSPSGISFSSCSGRSTAIDAHTPFPSSRSLRMLDLMRRPMSASTLLSSMKHLERTLGGRFFSSSAFSRRTMTVAVKRVFSSLRLDAFGAFPLLQYFLWKVLCEWSGLDL